MKSTGSNDQEVTCGGWDDHVLVQLWHTSHSSPLIIRLILSLFYSFFFMSTLSSPLCPYLSLFFCASHPALIWLSLFSFSVVIVICGISFHFFRRCISWHCNDWIHFCVPCLFSSSHEYFILSLICFLKEEMSIKILFLFSVCTFVYITFYCLPLITVRWHISLFFSFSLLMIQTRIACNMPSSHSPLFVRGRKRERVTECIIQNAEQFL